MRNKLTPLSIFRDLALKKRETQRKIIVYLNVFYRVYTDIPKLYGLVVYSFMDFLGDIVTCISFGNEIQSIIIWKAQGVPQLNNVAHPKHPEEEETSLNRNHIITGKQ